MTLSLQFAMHWNPFGNPARQAYDQDTVAICHPEGTDMLDNVDSAEKQFLSIFAVIQLIFQIIVGALFTLGLFFGQPVA